MSDAVMNKLEISINLLFKHSGLLNVHHLSLECLWRSHLTTWKFINTAKLEGKLTNLDTPTVRRDINAAQPLFPSPDKCVY